MIQLTLSPFQLMGVLAVLFLAAVGACHLCHAILVGGRDMRRLNTTPPEPVSAPEPVPAPVTQVFVEPWADRDDDAELLPASRYAAETEQTPMCPPLPKADSLAWNFKGFGLDDPQRTGAWPIIKGFDELDLDEQLAEPKQMPGFEVTEGDRKRFVQSDAQLAEAAEKVSAKRPKRKQQRQAMVDLENNKVAVTV